MMPKAFCLLATLCLFGGCHERPKSSWPYQEITGRGEERSLYRVSLSPDWIRQESYGPRQDTTVPLCEYTLKNMRLTIHNFPSEEIKTRIPPQAQTARWKRQFSSLNPQSLLSTPHSFSGYVGLKFEATGTLDSREIKMIAWSMQMASEHYPHCDPEERADVTIKIVGPIDEVCQYQEEIELLARSFELIEGK